jgi:hypothetical protein
MLGDAALEARHAGGRGLNLADKIDPRHLAEDGRAGGNVDRLLADLGDEREDHGLAGHQAHEFADRGVLVARRAAVELDRGMCAAHQGDAADTHGFRLRRRAGICL